MVAAYTALDLAGRVTAARGHAKWFWLAGGATSMGLGIWSMHYIGMLAFTQPSQFSRSEAGTPCVISRGAPKVSTTF
jgi:diguanylate cyclase